MVRRCATKAAPPARRNPEASGREKKSLPTWTWKSVRAWLLRTGVAPHPLRSGWKRPRLKSVFWLWAGLLGGYPLGPSTNGLWTAPNPVVMVFLRQRANERPAGKPEDGDDYAQRYENPTRGSALTPVLGGGATAVHQVWRAWPWLNRGADDPARSPQSRCASAAGIRGPRSTPPARPRHRDHPRTGR